MSTEHNPDNLADGAPLNVGEGYERVPVGDMLCPGVDCYSVLRGEWFETGLNEPLLPGSYGIYRRRITPDAGKAEAETKLGKCRLCGASIVAYFDFCGDCINAERAKAEAGQLASRTETPENGGGGQASSEPVYMADFPHPNKPEFSTDCDPCAAKLPEIPAQQPAEAMPETDEIRSLEETLAWELEEANLNPNDLATVNREKLRGVAGRVIIEAERRLTAALAEVERVKAENERLKATFLETPELKAAEELREYKERTRDVHVGKYGGDYYKCFHCKSVFTDEVEARQHFGQLDEVPDCAQNLERITQLFRYRDQECTDLRAQLSTERAARELLSQSYELACADFTKVSEQRDAAQRSLAESESREHQAREALERAYEYYGLENQVDPTAGTEFELAEAMREAMDNSTSTTVADLRRKLETAERERDAVAKALKGASKQIGHACWICEHLAAEEPINTPREWQAQAEAFAKSLEEIDAALATTQETK